MTIKTIFPSQKQIIEASSTHGSPSAATLDAVLNDDLASGTILIDGDTDMEQVVYATNEDCNKGTRLVQFLGLCLI